MTHLQSSPKTPACPVCGCSVHTGEEIHNCPGCDTPHHSECWEYNEGCAIYACDGKPRKELAPIEPEKRLGSIALDSRFEFYDERSPASAIERSFISATIYVIIMAAVLSSGYFAAFITLTAMWYLYTSFKTKTRIDGRRRVITRSLALGPLMLKEDTIPFSSVSLLNLDDCFSEEGTEHKRLLRGSLALTDGSSLRIALDIEEKSIKDDDIERWAKALQEGTALMITHVIVPRRRILTKRIRAFQHAIETSKNSQYYDIGLVWKLRWLVFLPSCIFADILTSVRHGGLDGLIITIFVFFLTVLFLFFRPQALFNLFYGAPREAINPYPEGYLEFDEKGTLKKLAGFLTFVEEKELPSLRSEEELERLKLFANGLIYGTPIIWLLVYGLSQSELLGITVYNSIYSYIGLFHLALIAALGAAMQRAVWDEQWVRDWLHESSKALSYDPGEHGHRYRIRDRNAVEKEPIVIDKRGALPIPDEFTGQWQDPDESQEKVE